MRPCLDTRFAPFDYAGDTAHRLRSGCSAELVLGCTEIKSPAWRLGPGRAAVLSFVAVYPKHKRPSLQAREGFFDLEHLDSDVEFMGLLFTSR